MYIDIHGFSIKVDFWYAHPLHGTNMGPSVTDVTTSIAGWWRGKFLVLLDLL